MSGEHVLPHDWYPRPLPPNVVLGERSWLYSAYAFRHYRSRWPCGVRLGHDSGVYHGTYFDLGPDGEVTIGDYCSIVGAILATNGLVEIGDYTFLAHEVVIADTFAAVPPDGPTDGPAQGIVVGPNAWVGARAILLGGTALGEGVIVGAAAVVEGPVPPFAIVAGNPARVVGWARPAE
jgi:acetyltransferase-like isoleucine patch superfamily enzyme